VKTRYLIVNADDFGASAGVNRGILEAHRGGVLTSTSLMVDAAGSAEAAALSRTAPELSVGLHVDLDGHHRTAARCFQEIARQADRFVELMGRRPTHLDSHHNVHRDPLVLPALLALSRGWAIPLRGHSPVRYLPKFYGQWGGESHPEQIGVASLVRMLESDIGEGFTELSCHPGYCDAALASGYAREREIEVRTLCDPEIRAALSRLDIGLVSYHDLDGALAD
jgi:chitin disaccharide deacetylase